MFADIWDNFSPDRSLFCKDGLHFSYIGKASLVDYSMKSGQRSVEHRWKVMVLL